MKKKIWFLVLIFSLVLNFFLYQNLQKSEKSSDQDLVVEVLDGDTFVLQAKQRVRMLEMDAPEPDFCGGQEAKKRLEELILGKKVTLREILIDKYGRILALVYINDVFVNKVMLAEGQAMYIGPMTSQGKYLKKVYNEAKEAKLGIFGPECFQKENIERPDCLIKGNLSQRGETLNRKIYHFPGCSGYSGVIIEKFRGEDWFCSESEAKKAGFRISENCFGKKYTPQE